MPYYSGSQCIDVVVAEIKPAPVCFLMMSAAEDQ